jgi:FMN phosphatase YigB (HAD superfamily)
MYHLKNSIFILAVLLSSCLHGMKGESSSATVLPKENTVISCDLDDFMTGALEFPDDVCAELSNENWKDVMTHNCNRYPLLQRLYSDNADLIDRQLATRIETSEGLLFVYPVMAVIETIKQLKNKGYLVVAATNQPVGSHIRNYRRALFNHYGIDLNDLFRAVLAVAPNRRNDSFAYCADKQNNIHAVFDEKPTAGYFNALKELVLQLDNTVTKIVHIDDREDNVRGAGRVNSMAGVHFNVPGGCVLEAKPEQLESAITNLKNDLKSHGVLLD